MARWSRCWAPALLFFFSFVALAAPEARAQEPKTGSYYPIPSLGFQVKVPAKWESVPPSPNEKNLIVKFDPPGLKYIQIGKTNSSSALLFVHCWLLKFDRRKSDQPKDDKKVDFGSGDKSLAAWVKGGECGPGFAVEGKPVEFEVNKVPATQYEFTSSNKAFEEPVKLYAVVYKLEPDLDVAIVFNSPADSRKWSKWERTFTEMAKSFKRLDVKDAGVAADTSNMTLREKKEAELRLKLKDTPEWKLYPTPHYIIVSSNEDKAFIDELIGRIEAIHSIYEADYPIEKAKELRAEGKKLRTGEQGSQAGKDKKDDEDGESKLADMIMGDADPQELAKCSVVRVCKDSEQYFSYGGPPSSAGYWNWVEQELVVYDARKEGGKSDTWAVVNHEAFHQYIFYLYGNISPQSWYNEGTGDFYSGYQYKNKQFKLEKFQWRIGTIKETIQAGQTIPLKEFVRWSQAEYYGKNKYASESNNKWGTGGHNYAQGWSFIYFLRTGKKGGAKNWDPRWDSILDIYFKELAMTGKTDKAVDAAFNGVDMDALEASWKDYTN